MEDLENIRLNINSSIVKLKREWNSVRETWKDSKAKEYEKISYSCRNKAVQYFT